MIFTLVFAAGILPILGIGVYSNMSNASTVQDEVIKQNDIFMDEKIDAFNLFFDTQRKNAELIAGSSVIRLGMTMHKNGVPKDDPDWVRVSSDMVEYINYVQDLQGYRFVATIGNDGLLVKGYDDLYEGVDLNSRGYFQHTMATGEQIFTELYFSDVTQVTDLSLSTPVFEKNGDSNPIGVLVIDLETALIGEAVHKGVEKLGDLGDSYVILSDGLLMTETLHGEYATESIMQKTIETEVQELLSGPIENKDTTFKGTKVYETYDGRKVIGSYAVVQFGEQYAGLVVETDFAEAMTNANSTRNIVYIVTGVVALLGILLAFIMGNGIIKPINNVTNAAKKVVSGDLTVKLDKNRAKDQIYDLTVSFDNLIKKTNNQVKVLDDIVQGNIKNLNLEGGTKDQLNNGLFDVTEILNGFSNELTDVIVDVIYGRYTSRVDADKYTGVYYELAHGFNQLIEQFVSTYDNLPFPFYTLDPKEGIAYANVTAMALGQATSMEQLIGVKQIGNVDFINDEPFASSKATGRAAKNEVVFNLNGVDSYVETNAIPMKNDAGEVASLAAFVIDHTETTLNEKRMKKIADFQENEVRYLVENLEKLSNGNFNLEYHELNVDEDTKEIASIFENINKNLKGTVDNLSSYISEITQILEKLAAQDLRIEITREYKGEFNDIKDALFVITEAFNGIVGEIIVASQGVNIGSGNVNDSSSVLSQGATEQAAAIEEISATVTQVAAQVQENANNAENVQLNAQQASEQAVYSNEQMSMLVGSMKEVQKSTQSIQKVLKMINDIAFQTNILSLNAAVEAARAGQHGKGFAVIAEDVRNLALKSATAADETTDMLDSIVSQINDSVTYANETAETLKGIVDSSKESVKKSSEVATASNEQASAIGQITLSLDQISQVVQTTSAAAQRGAQTSKELSGRARQLLDAVGDFKLKDESITKELKKEPQSSAVIYKEPAKKKDDEVIIDLDDMEF
jgi:methyl-accepting chemotaxis protein